jgi:hypothetical protein
VTAISRIDTRTRDIVRSAADQLSQLAEDIYRDGNCTDEQATDAAAVDGVRNKVLALIGEVHYLRDGEPFQVGECMAGHGLPCACAAVSFERFGATR